jgi:secreted trypsin-like serine protease
MRLNSTLSAAAISLVVVGSASVASASPLADFGPGSASERPSSRIIGGEDAPPTPFAARVLDNGRGICTSTLIAPKFILTANHCVVNENLSFRVNSNNDSLEGGEVVKMVKVFHAEGADLSVVELEKEVSGTYSQLATQNPEVGSTVEILGWGATELDDEASTQAKKLKVAKVEFDGLTKDYKGGQALNLTKIDGIAAGGDSGGPAVFNGAQVGVASTSNRWSNTQYTAVANYVSWIKKVAGLS